MNLVRSYLIYLNHDINKAVKSKLLFRCHFKLIHRAQFAVQTAEGEIWIIPGKAFHNTLSLFASVALTAPRQ